MKTYLSILAILCFSVCSQAADEKPAPDAVVVKVLSAPLPHEEDKRAKFLWDTFANKPEEKQFNHYTTEKWKDNFAVFSKALIQKAKDQNLDTDSLRKMLDLVLKHSKGKIAYLPVGAYQTTLDGGPVWIITVKWEYPSKDEAPGLGHIRMFAFDQKTMKQVAFDTCM
jgi:hypothetical protein